jgi:hypothetical protein
MGCIVFGHDRRLVTSSKLDLPYFDPIRKVFRLKVPPAVEADRRGFPFGDFLPDLFQFRFLVIGYVEESGHGRRRVELGRGEKNCLTFIILV